MKNEDLMWPEPTDDLDALRVAVVKNARALGMAQCALATVEMNLYAAEERLRRERQKILCATPDPKTLGANEAQREAALSTLCVDAEEAVTTHTHNRITVRADLEAARTAVDCCRHLIRIASLLRFPDGDVGL